MDSDRLRPGGAPFSGRVGAAVVVCVACLAALAWSNRFVQDDAFISFRYARNLVDGLGLVWNPGERVEGYSNFLWTLLVAGAMQLGIEPVLFTELAGLACFCCSLLLAWRIAVESGLGAVAALVSLLLVGTNYTFSCYATGGLETSVVTALFMGGCLAAVRILTGRTGRDRGLLALSALTTVAVLTRMDSLLLFGGLAFGVLLAGGRQDLVRGLVRFTLLPALLLLPWLVWKYSYYGDIFPRAFYLKAVGGASPERGLRYFYAFLMSYNLAPFLFFCLFFFGAIFRRENKTQFVMAGTVLLWFAYVLKVGGDFMEFRFLVPVLPPMMILLVWLLFGCTRRTWLRAAGVLLVLGGSLHHALTFSYDRGTGVEPVGMLRGHLSAPDENWTGIGEALAAAFTPADGVTIATTAAGAIPYYSGLKSVDMLGLNEPSEKPRDGSGDGDEGGPESVQVGYVTGHQRVVTYDYLNRRGVNLVISHPIVTKPGDPPAPLPLLPTGGPPHMSGKLLLMSIGDGYSVEMLYIRPNAAIDSAIARHGWPARPVVL